MRQAQSKTTKKQGPKKKKKKENMGSREGGDGVASASDPTQQERLAAKGEIDLEVMGLGKGERHTRV